MIPRVLHRIVLPPMTGEGQPDSYWHGLRGLHPGWTLKTWTSARPQDWPEVGHLLKRCRSAAQRADLMRLEVLWREGGVYVDTDCEGVRPLDGLLDPAGGFFIGTDDSVHLANTVMGATPQHPAVRAYLDAVLAGFDPKLPPNRTTGPHLATKVLTGRPDVTVHPPVLFYSEPPNSDPLHLRPTAADVAVAHPEALLVHRWAHSWAPPAPLHERARRAVGHARRLARQRLARSRGF